MKSNLSILIFFCLSIFTYLSTNASCSSIIITEINDTIDQGTVEIVKESLNLAKIEEAQGIILLINTPGGGLEETFKIATLINMSEIPFIGYVYPTGSAAWSAGTFILMSTHISVMGNHTIIGSCQPVEISLTGSRLINDSKRINALATWIETRAEMNDRNGSISRKFVTENLNLNETEALKFGVIDYTASSIDHLINVINGTVVSTNKGEITIRLMGVNKIRYSPSLKIIIIKFFSNPIISGLLFFVGIFAIIFGISSPGFGAEIFGIIAIMLFLLGSGFSVPILSIIFIIMGFLLLISEIYIIPGFGIIGIGGIICLIIGLIFLVPSHSIGWAISMNWINNVILIMLTAAIIISIFFIFLVYKILRIRKKKSVVGSFIGQTGKTIDKVEPNKISYIRFKGELWQAISEQEIDKNTKVIIIDKDDTLLKVKQKEGKN
jgi:membrane-bound serine protease (ClpP class)